MAMEMHSVESAMLALSERVTKLEDELNRLRRMATVDQNVIKSTLLSVRFHDPDLFARMIEAITGQRDALSEFKAKAYDEVMEATSSVEKANWYVDQITEQEEQFNWYIQAATINPPNKFEVIDGGKID